MPRPAGADADSSCELSKATASSLSPICMALCLSTDPNIRTSETFCMQALGVAQACAAAAVHNADAQGLLVLMLHVAVPPGGVRDAQLLPPLRRLQLCRPESCKHIEVSCNFDLTPLPVPSNPWARPPGVLCAACTQSYFCTSASVPQPLPLSRSPFRTDSAAWLPHKASLEQAVV